MTYIRQRFLRTGHVRRPALRIRDQNQEKGASIMHPARKIYCRTFQSVLKFAIPFLPYRHPKIIGSVRGIPEVLKKKKCRSVLIVTDKGIANLGMLRRLKKSLRENHITYVIYDKTVANPTTVNVYEAAALYHSGHCSAIIAFGGGSSIDCAKAVGVKIARPDKPLAKMKGILKVHTKLPLLIAIPTTAGTGSETTIAAVITDAETRHKYTINDFPLIPRYAVLDPEVTVSLPPFITACTGMDALTHAVEAYIGNSTTPGTRKNALMAVSLIFKNLDTAVKDGTNLEARKNMLKASYYAGCAFTKSYVGYVHAVAHSLGGAYNIPHGYANAVLLPYVLDSYGECIHKKLHALAVAAGIAKRDIPHYKGARLFIYAIQNMKKRYGIGNTIEEIREEDIPKLAHYADKEANPLYPVPVLMNAEELEKFYYMLMPKKKRQPAPKMDFKEYARKAAAKRAAEAAAQASAKAPEKPETTTQPSAKTPEKSETAAQPSDSAPEKAGTTAQASDRTPEEAGTTAQPSDSAPEKSETAETVSSDSKTEE